MGSDIVDQMFIGRALQFLEQHNYKGLLGFLSMFITLPSFIWLLSFSSYLSKEETEQKIFESDECQNLLGWSISAATFYGLSCTISLVLSIWGYFVMGWEQPKQSQNQSPDEFMDEIQKKPILSSTEGIYKWFIRIFPGAYFFLVIIIFFGISWNLDDVDHVTCQPLRSQALVFIVLHITFFTIIALVICCGLLGTGTYLHQYGFDDIMDINPYTNQHHEEESQSINNNMYKSTLSQPYYGTKNDDGL